MPRQITQRELRNDSAAIFRAIESGESFILTRNGTPIGEVTPIRHKRTFVPVEEIKAAFAHMPKIDYEEFRRDIDAGIDPYLSEDDDPWARRDRRRHV